MSIEQDKIEFEKAMTELYRKQGAPLPNASGNNGLFRQDSSGEYNTAMGHGAWLGWQARAMNGE